ncbi:uncharacterized protein [Coffea arabica]|uniref:Uncharacterized protein LOC113725695 isoform X1 n=1 Tax=Coffea arabica TaxID=13443 RepID=A0A6P6VQ64_COFAR|nr:uncharacterized protein LOC113725695 isoform X1 [Coffea arabica]XP_027104797.1 uncharacterized protein LOC113725695 isoform X1 [Coffea arabica]
MRSYRPSTLNAHYKMSFEAMRTKEKSKPERRVHGVAIHDDAGRKDFCDISLRMLKRASPYSSTVLDAYTGTQNVNAVGREGKRQRVDQATFRRKVDAFAYPGVSPIEKCTHNTFYKGVSGYYDLNRAKVNTAVTGSNIAASSEDNDFDCDASSVGSCSASSMRADKFSNFAVAVPFLGTDMLSTDAESYCRSFDEVENLSHCSKESVEVSIHKLELHAYRCTLEALYASGPLSWDKELLLTNLRIMLHISNDEHLTELKNLIPSGSTQ